MKLRRLISSSCLALVFASVFSSRVVAGPQLAPVNLEASWSGSYLLNYIFLSDYSLLWKGSEPIDADALVSPGGYSAWKRAVFAVHAMNKRGQAFYEFANVSSLLDRHAVMLRSKFPNIEQDRARLLASAERNQNDTGVESANIEAGFELVAQSFIGESQQNYAKMLSRLYAAEIPSCPISATDVMAFAEHQAKLQEQSESINGGKLIAPITAWSLKKVRCLVFAMMATPPDSKKNQGTDPIHLMLTFQQLGSPLVRDMAYKSIFAIRLLQTNQFAETLRVLVDLAELQSEYRLPYEMVQRIFSVRQKGDGQVALKGI